MNSTMTSSIEAECLSSQDSSVSEDRVTITVQTPTGAFEFPCESGETLLHAGLKAGLSLPYECATGTCGSCRGRLMTGDVDIGWEQSPALAKLKREKGDILLCQAKAKSDCLVRVAAKVAELPVDDAPAKFKGRICDSRILTQDVIEFTVDLSTPMTFLPGQFALLQSPYIVGARAYSMVNHSAEPDRIVFVVKRKRDGGFCNWLFRESIDGTEVDVFGPLGRATLDEHENRDLIIAAGGSGIAGMMSILECATRRNYFASHRGHVVFGVPTLQDGFYLDELAEYVAKAQGALKVTLALSNETPQTANHPDHDEIQLAGGFVHTAMPPAPDQPGNTLAFLAGPPPMVDAVLRALISEWRLSPQAIRYDKFG
jgi:toluene monooxygenase electron transfer component